MIDKKDINKLFANLRKRGLAARQMCGDCNSCGHAEMCDDLDANDKLIGAVFYHDQEWDRYCKTGRLNLGYFGQTDRGAMKVAKIIVEEAKRIGLGVAWDGKTNQKIEIS